MEKDDKLARKLHEGSSAGNGQLQVINGDVLRINLQRAFATLREMGRSQASQHAAAASAPAETAPEPVVAQADAPAHSAVEDAAVGHSDAEAEAVAEVSSSMVLQRIRIMANLPYNITTDVLKRLLPQGDEVSHITLVLQHEVAQRLCQEHIGARSVLGC